MGALTIEATSTPVKCQRECIAREEFALSYSESSRIPRDPRKAKRGQEKSKNQKRIIR